MVTTKICYSIVMINESTKNIINLIILYLISTFSVLLFFASILFLYPIGYFADALSYLGILSVIGILFIYKKPNIAKKLFLTTVFGSIFAVLLYIFTTSQDWNTFTFLFILLTLPCILLTTLAIRFLK